MASTKRIAVIGDSHFDEHSRFDECIRLHDWIVDDIRARGVDLIVHAGDVFERKSTVSERREVARFLMHAAELAPVLVVRGNHDALGDLALFEKLETKHPIRVEEAFSVQTLGGVEVAAMAWPRRSELAKQAGSHDEIEHVANDAMRALLHGLSRKWIGDAPRLFVAHAMVSGSVTSVGQPLVGMDMEISLEDLALAEADFYALGHIHKPQDWLTPTNQTVAYTGSPRRTAFGEVEDKSYLLVTIGDVLATHERIVVPATPMLLIEAEWNEGRLDITSKTFPHAITVDGAEVRLRYATVSDQRDAARVAASRLRDTMIEDGAISVKVEEEVVPIVRARAPEITLALTTEQKLGALWKARNVVPEPKRAFQLLKRADQLEEEIRDAV